MTKINFRVDSSENFQSANTELSKGEPTLSSSFPYELKVSPSDGSTWDQAISINPVTEYTPTTINEVFAAGLITFDNNFLYIKTNDGWKQLALADLGSITNPPEPPVGPTTTTTTPDPSSTTTPDPSSTTTPDPSSTTTPDPSSTTTTTTVAPTTTTTTTSTTTTTLPPASFATSIFTFGLDEDNIKDDTTSATNLLNNEALRQYTKSPNSSSALYFEEVTVDGALYKDWGLNGDIIFTLRNVSSTLDDMNVSVALKQGNNTISTSTETTPYNNIDTFKLTAPLLIRPDFDPTNKSYWSTSGTHSQLTFVNGKVRAPANYNLLTLTSLMQEIANDNLGQGLFLFADNPDFTLEITTNQYYRLFFHDYTLTPSTQSSSMFHKSISDWGNILEFPSYIKASTDASIDNLAWDRTGKRGYGSIKTRLKSLPSSIPSWFSSLKTCFAGTSDRLTSSVASWDTSNIIDMEDLCFDSLFNQDISSWNTSNVKYFNSAFASHTPNDLYFGYDSQFNRPIGSWDTSAALEMISMFHRNFSFDQTINNWDVSKVTLMTSMFYLSIFNQDISNWDTSNVGSMSNMFWSNAAFNQPIGTWDTSSLTNMSRMFQDATSFDQVLSNWTLDSLNSTPTSFAEDSGFTQDNFKNTVIAFDNNTSDVKANSLWVKFSPVLGPSSDNAYLTAFFSLEGKKIYIRDADS